MLLHGALRASICGCGQIAHSFSASKCGRSSRALRRDLHMQAHVLRCIHLHPLLARDLITRTFPRQQRPQQKLCLRGGAEHRGVESCRARTFSPLQGFAFHSPVGLNPPRSDKHMQKDSQKKKKRGQKHGPEEQEEDVGMQINYFVFWLKPLRKKWPFTGLLKLWSGLGRYRGAVTPLIL